MLVVGGTVWHRGAQHHTTYVLHPEKRHNGECADCQETTAALIAAGALCVWEGGGRKMCPGSWRRGGVELLVLGGGG